MPEFDEFLNSLRDDCDTPLLAPSAEVRRIAGRRTVAVRAVGGLASLLLVGGALAGFVALRGSTHTPAPVAQPAVHQLAVSPRAADSPASAPVPPVHTPASTPKHTTTTPTHSSATHTPTGTPACVPGDFGTHATINDDDAAGIIGYDITLTAKSGTHCKLGQPARLYYTSNGYLVAFGVQAGNSTTPVTVNHGATAMFSIWVHDGTGSPTPPAGCATQHTYHGLEVRIGSGNFSLGSAQLQFPCTGAGTTSWSTS